MRFFTKSVFREAYECPARLNYCNRKDEYANQNLTDDFLDALAEGGFQIGELAKVYYDVPADNDLNGGNEEVVVRTKELLKTENVTITEAAFIFGRCFCRVDILRKSGDEIELVEVKAKSWGGEKDVFLSQRAANGLPKGSVRSEIREYVYDVAFQKYVVVNALREMFPGKTFSVRAALMMADKNKVADRNRLNRFFKIEKRDGKPHVTRTSGVEVLRDGEPLLTTYWEVDGICDRIIAGESPEEKIVLHGWEFVSFVNEMSARYCDRRQVFDDIELSTECFKCPYYSTGKDSLRDGYDECWEKATAGSHDPYVDYESRPLLENLWGGQCGSMKDDILKSGKWFLDQITMEDITPKNEQTASGPGLLPRLRRWVQIALTTGHPEKIEESLRRNVRAGVYLDIEGLRTEMSKWEFPLHMIDFETTAAALPFYRGMKPYESVAFQFSHHIIERTDGNGGYKVRHAGQWLNVEPEFPNFEFVRKLKRSLGDKGTIFRYSNHENTILRLIRRQLLERNDQPDAPQLVEFIDSITHPTDDEGDGAVPTRDMVDLWDVVKRFYYDPRMKGSNSIKAVLPAVLNGSDFLKKKYSRPIYGSMEMPSMNYRSSNPKIWIEIMKGEVLSPYKQLDEISAFFPEGSREIVRRSETLPSEDESMFDSQINHGGAALWAYGLLQFCLDDKRKRDALVKALYRYCELDTLAMVFIWEYFNSMTH